MVSQYDKLFADWQATTKEQAVILDRSLLRMVLTDPPAFSTAPAGSAPRRSVSLDAGYEVTAS